MQLPINMIVYIDNIFMECWALIQDRIIVSQSGSPVQERRRGRLPLLGALRGPFCSSPPLQKFRKLTTPGSRVGASVTRLWPFFVPTRGKKVPIPVTLVGKLSEWVDAKVGNIFASAFSVREKKNYSTIVQNYANLFYSLGRWLSLISLFLVLVLSRVRFPKKTTTKLKKKKLNNVGIK